MMPLVALVALAALIPYGIGFAVAHLLWRRDVRALRLSRDLACQRADRLEANLEQERRKRQPRDPATGRMLPKVAK